MFTFFLYIYKVIEIIWWIICSIAAKSEWKILYLLCKDENGLLPKETIRSVYDGSLFEQMAKEKQSKKHRYT